MKKETILNDIKNKMKAEKMAIDSQLQAFGKIAGIVQKFDGKVINKRFYTALEKETGKNFFRDGFYFEHLDREITVLVVRDAVKTIAGKNEKYIYPKFYERGELEIARNEGGKMDAEKTLKNLAGLIERLQAAEKEYTFSEVETLEIIEKMEEIGGQLDRLFTRCDFITRENIKRISYHLR